MLYLALRANVLGRGVFQQYHKHSLSIARKYATSKPPPAISKQPVPTNTGRYTSPLRAPSQQHLDARRRLARIELTENLFRSGVRELYKAPARISIFRFQNWFLAGVMIGGVLLYQKYGLLDMREFQKRGQSRVIYFLYVVIASFLCAVAGFLLYRTRGHVHAISLVERSNHIFVNITTRRFLPFLKTNILAKPETLILRDKLIIPQGTPEHAPAQSNAQPSVIGGVAISVRDSFRALVAATRMFFSSEGMIGLDIVDENPSKKDESKGYTLDFSGGWAVSKTDGLPVLFHIANVEKRPSSMGLLSLFK